MIFLILEWANDSLKFEVSGTIENTNFDFPVDVTIWINNSKFPQYTLWNSKKFLLSYTLEKKIL